MSMLTPIGALPVEVYGCATYVDVYRLGTLKEWWERMKRLGRKQGRR